MTDRVDAREKERQELRSKRIGSAGRALVSSLMEPPQQDADFLSLILNVKHALTDDERQLLLEVLCGTFAPDHLEDILTAHFVSAGFPSAQYMGSPMSDATYWAADANAAELKAYGVACFKRMSPKGRAAFVDWASKQND